MNQFNKLVGVRRPIDRSRYYKSDELTLPGEFNAYFHYFSQPYLSMDNTERMIDIAYMLAHGYNLKQEMKYYLYDNPDIRERDLQWGLFYILFNFKGEGAKKHIETCDYSTMDEFIDFFTEQVLEGYHESPSGSMMILDRHATTFNSDNTASAAPRDNRLNQKAERNRLSRLFCTFLTNNNIAIHRFLPTLCRKFAERKKSR